MSKLNEKHAFSERLISALIQAGYTTGPTALAKEFNLRFNGPEVSVQSANNWLQGKAIPSQDKLTILSLWLGISSQWLRFGEKNVEDISHSESEQAEDLDLLIQFKSLTNTQKKIIQSLITEFKNI